MLLQTWGEVNAGFVSFLLCLAFKWHIIGSTLQFASLRALYWCNWRVLPAIWSAHEAYFMLLPLCYPLEVLMQTGLWMWEGFLVASEELRNILPL